MWCAGPRTTGQSRICTANIDQGHGCLVSLSSMCVSSGSAEKNGLFPPKKSAIFRISAFRSISPLCHCAIVRCEIERGKLHVIVWINHDLDCNIQARLIQLKELFVACFFLLLLLPTFLHFARICSDSHLEFLD